MVSNIGAILETRIGLKTIKRKKITARGVKPIGLVQWNFKAYYLYGAVAPQTGENFWSGAGGVTKSLRDRPNLGCSPYTLLIKATFISS